VRVEGEANRGKQENKTPDTGKVRERREANPWGKEKNRGAKIEQD